MKQKYDYHTFPMIIHNGQVLQGGGSGLEEYLKTLHLN